MSKLTFELSVFGLLSRNYMFYFLNFHDKKQLEDSAKLKLIQITFGKYCALFYVMMEYTALKSFKPSIFHLRKLTSC